jgi:hypothetical protein
VPKTDSIRALLPCLAQAEMKLNNHSLNTSLAPIEPKEQETSRLWKYRNG